MTLKSCPRLSHGTHQLNFRLAGTACSYLPYGQACASSAFNYECQLLFSPPPPSGGGACAPCQTVTTQESYDCSYYSCRSCVSCSPGRFNQYANPRSCGSGTTCWRSGDPLCPGGATCDVCTAWWCLVACNPIYGCTVRPAGRRCRQRRKAMGSPADSNQDLLLLFAVPLLLNRLFVVPVLCPPLYRSPPPRPTVQQRWDVSTVLSFR